MDPGTETGEATGTGTRPPRVEPPPRGAPPGMGTWLLVIVLLVQFMVSLDVSVVNVALPAIRSGLGFSDQGLTWTVNAYALTFGGLMMLGGRLGDVIGRRRTLLGGLVVFGLASLAGGLMQSPGGLIAARAVQGAGAAALTPVALALLTVNFPPGPALSRALGLWGVTAAAGGAVGVLGGGLLTGWFGWRSVLLINVPIVAFALVVGLRLAPDRREGARPRLDLGGAALVTSGAALLVLGVVRAQSVSWGSATTGVTLGAAVLLLGAFALVELRSAEPLLRLSLLTRRPVVGANVFMMLLFSAQFAAFYFCSLYLHEVLGYGPVATGASFLPFCVGTVIGAAIATRAVARTGLRLLLAGGGFAGAAGLVWMGAEFTAGAGFAGAILGPTLLASIGIGMCFVPLGTAATAGVGEASAGMASGLINSSRQVGGSIGLAGLEALAAAAGGRSGEAHGFGAAILAAGGLVAVAASTALLLIPRTPPPR
ncbi:MFS transporter [Streptomyces sp. CA-111067]|uniref:MFS transporter n=1 Tax=Streptomyces sp. CA-111067 TaxID=3240046 RepID=UPI003D987784